MWILRFFYETNGNDQTWLAISILHLLQASQIQDLRVRHIRMLAPPELIERTVIDEVMKILKSPEVLMNLNRLAEEKQEISKSDLMAALKNLNEAWNYLYAVELAA